MTLESHALSGKIAVVTGAARGIGRSTAVALAGAGADVVGIDICAPVSPILDLPPATPEQLDETGKLVAYSASKWGFIGLMKSAALELGPHELRVNAVIPGFFDTALIRHEDRYAQAIQSSGGEPSGDEQQDEQRTIESKAKSTPLGVQWLDPDDVAPVVVFLASDAARMVSGTSYAVTGGDSAHVTA